MKKTVPSISCHHGDIDHQNNIEAAVYILHDNPDIDIMEIDFVLYGKELISSHDYSAHSILNGATLLEWIELVIIKEKKVLWIDLKPKIDLSVFFWSIAKEEVNCLSILLDEACSRWGIWIRPYILMTSQDPTITHEIEQTLSRNYQIVADIPNMSSYVWQDILPFGLQGWLDDSVYDHFMNRYDFSRHPIVAIDKSFFGHSVKRVLRFIYDSSIKEGTTIIIYNFKVGAPIVRDPLYNIVMQYDFKHI